jgi:hypothetical protein
LSTFGWFNYNHYKYFDNKYLIPTWDGQISPAKSGQGYWLFQSTADKPIPFSK